MSWRGSAAALAAAAALTASLSIGVTSAVAAPPAAGDLVVNEVESNGGTPGDWVELLNKGPAAADIGGYVVRDNDDTHTYVIPAGTTIAAGGYYLADVDSVATAGGSAPFGLGSADSARLLDPDGTLLDSYTWSAHAATTYGRCPDGTGAFATTASSTRGAANACGTTPPADGALKINEVESNGGTPGDWVELVNTGAAAADIGGYVVRDDDDTHTYVIPAGTTIAAGGYYLADVDSVATAGGSAPFGLGSADSARLLTPGGTLVDSYTWSAHAATTYGRCPDGTGVFTTTGAPTRGAVNACPGDPGPWPGGAGVATADPANLLGGNMSGLAYQPSGSGARGTLWAVKNGPSTLYRLRFDGTTWSPDPATGWAAGKDLNYPSGTGDPDAEGVTLVGDDPANGVYVSTERDNANSGVSRPAVLRFDVSATGTALDATNDWNLTSDLPGLGANLGLEAIQWLSDSFLVAHGFRDEATNAPYNPATYPGHGSGLFFVGVEQTGNVYAYALKSDNTFTRVATIASGFPAVMDLEFEPESGHLWAVCDDTCGGRTATLDIAQSGPDAGRFVVTNTYARPSGMPNLNNEGFAIAPRAECVGGLKPVFWVDDGNTDGHARRSGTLNCAPQTAQTITFPAPAGMAFGDGPQALSASASSGLPVTLAASGPCTLSGAQLTATGAGTCTVVASQPGSADVAAAADVTRTVTIDKASTALVQRQVGLVRSVLQRRITFQATLTSRVTGLPIAGAAVAFGLRGRGTACTATTNASGVAGCTSSPKGMAALLVLAGQTTATYAGSADYAGSTSTRSIALL